MRCLFVLPLLLLAACAEPPPAPLPPGEAAERNSVLALLRTLDGEALGAAFDRLDGKTYEVEARTEQIDADGTTTATRRRTLRVAPTGTTLIAADSAGDFDYGAFGSLVDREGWDDERGGNPVALVLPEEPAWLDPRGREAFHFGFGPDTLLGGRRVRVLTVEARPGEGDEQPIRRARLWLDVGTGTLVGVRLERRLESVLFGEASDALVLLRPGRDGWQPHRTRFETKLRAPLATPRRFRLTREYRLPAEPLAR